MACRSPSNKNASRDNCAPPQPCTPVQRSTEANKNWLYVTIVNNVIYLKQFFIA